MRTPRRVVGIAATCAGVIATGACSCFLFPQPAVSDLEAIGLQLVADGLTSPVKLVAPPDGSGRLFIVDQIGLIRIVDAAGTLLATPFLDVRSLMITPDPGGDERGLLGLAFHPAYAANGRFFVFYSAPKGGDIPASFNCETHISEFRVSGDPNVADAASEQILLRFGKPQANHNGGDLAFGPDGFLYASTGDGGGANDSGDGHTPGLGNAQDKGSLLGKILRLDVDSAAPYAIPASNPFVGEPGARGEIWAFGLRNPYRFAFDPGDSHRLFAGDVGQGLFEEVDLVIAGGNYGWRLREGLHCFDPDNSANPPATCADAGASGEPLIDPIVEYPHNTSGDGPRGIAVIGGAVYRGTIVPSLASQYIFGDLSRGFFFGDGSIFVAQTQDAANWTQRELAVAGTENGRFGRFILGFGQDAAGEVYICSSASGLPSGADGQVHRLTMP